MILSVLGKNHGSFQGLEMKKEEEKPKRLSVDPLGVAPPIAP